jgi:chemotaxis protein methyltransferase CheR
MQEKKIDIQDVRKIIALISQQYQFDFGEYAMSSFKRRLLRVLELHNFDSMAQLIDHLTKNKSFFEVFLKEITVNTTEMFRDPSFWKTLKEDVFPLVAKFPTIRIWHSGCSSGEEVFSMAIALKEAGLYEKTKVLASDINEDVIAKALTGVYPYRHMQLNETNYKYFGGQNNLSDYYTKSSDNVTMDLELLKNVTFKKIDLIQSHQYSKFDIILCRNVLIYFNVELQDRIVAKFSNDLAAGGFLVLGSKETIAWYKSYDLYTVFSSKERIFRKKLIDYEF